MTILRGLIIFFLAVLACAVQGQDEDSGKRISSHNMAIEISGGYSVALGKYTSLNKEDEKAGFAANGWQVQAAFSWMGKKDFGLSLLYAFQRNPLSNSADSIPLENFPDGFMLGPGAWSNHYLLAGPVFMKTIRKLYLDARILGGVIVSASPVFTTPNPGDTTGTDKDQNIATGFGYQVSATVGYALSPRFALKVSLALRGGWPGKEKQYPAQFLYYRYYRDPETGILVSEPVYSASADYQFNKVVTALEPSFGVVYRF